MVMSTIRGIIEEYENKTPWYIKIASYLSFQNNSYISSLKSLIKKCEVKNIPENDIRFHLKLIRLYYSKNNPQDTSLSIFDSLIPFIFPTEGLRIDLAKAFLNQLNDNKGINLVNLANLKYFIEHEFLCFKLYVSMDVDKLNIQEIFNIINQVNLSDEKLSWIIYTLAELWLIKDGPSAEEIISLIQKILDPAIEKKYHLYCQIIENVFIRSDIRNKVNLYKQEYLLSLPPHFAIKAIITLESIYKTYLLGKNAGKTIKIIARAILNVAWESYETFENFKVYLNDLNLLLLELRKKGYLRDDRRDNLRERYIRLCAYHKSPLKCWEVIQYCKQYNRSLNYIDFVKNSIAPLQVILVLFAIEDHNCEPDLEYLTVLQRQTKEDLQLLEVAICRSSKENLDQIIQDKLSKLPTAANSPFWRLKSDRSSIAQEATIEYKSEYKRPS